MANELNDKYQRAQPPDRAQKMLDILGAMVFDPDHMGKDNHRKGAGSGRINTGSWGKKTGYQAQQITGRNVKKYRGNERKKLAALFTGNIDHKFFHP
jgi:hypothetical protein